jgi:ribosomal protein S27E
MAVKFDKSQRDTYFIQDDSFNRGWALDLNRGHKIRISMPDYLEQMKYQATHGEAVSTTKLMEDNPEYQEDVKKEEEQQEAHWEDEKAAEEPAAEEPAAEAPEENDQKKPLPETLTEEVLDKLLPIPATYRLKRDLVTKGKSKLVTIHCVDCGAERQIKVQDQFQTTRCADCQKKFRAAKRRKANKAAKNPTE